MNHGPWTTALGNTSAAPLCAFWRRRMRMLALLTPVKRLPWRLQSALAVGAVALMLMPIVLFSPSVVAVKKVLADQTKDATGGDGAPLRLDLPGGVVAELVAIGAPLQRRRIGGDQTERSLKHRVAAIPIPSPSISPWK